MDVLGLWAKTSLVHVEREELEAKSHVQVAEMDAACAGQSFFMKGIRTLGRLLALPAITWGLSASPLRAQASPITLIYSTNPNYPPYQWAEDEKAFHGASVELLSHVLPVGVKAKPLVVPWKRALVMAEEGRIDLLLSLRITPERSAYLDFTKHRAFSNPIVIFVRKDRLFAFNAWSDLKGKRGGISQGDTFGAGFDEYWRKELQIEEALGLEENFKKLLAGRIDYFVSGLLLGRSYILKKNLARRVTSLDKPISTEGIHFAFSKKSKHRALKAAMEKKLEEANRKGLPEKLLQKHLKIYAHGGR